MILPDNFLESMNLILGDDLNTYKDSLLADTHHGMRINTAKINPEQFLELIKAYQIDKKVPWCDCGFYYDEEIPLTKNPYYYAGLYYIQEPSAMLPAAILPIEEGDFCLDLCAAPGGKSTQLAAKLNGTGFLLANDISNSRAKALLKNLELFGLANIAVTSENHEKLCECFPEYFDKILVDAPCSGEGMFRREPSMVKSWLEKGPEYYAEIQADILEHAYKMLKPGGMLLFSTCTFSPLENEANVCRLLENHSEAEIVPIKLSAGMRSGLTDEVLQRFGISIPKHLKADALTGCARIFPQDNAGEGHFAALIRKKGVSVQKNINSEKNDNSKIISMYPKAEEFLKLAADELLQNGNIVEINDKLYLLPKGFKLNENIRYLRTGLLLGELVKKPSGKNDKLKKGKNQKAEQAKSPVTRFEPSQALAMALHKDWFKNIVDLSVSDNEVIKYLKGETICCDEDCALDGWCLVTVDGFPLGFAIKNGDTLKNKYYPGWRLQ